MQHTGILLNRSDIKIFESGFQVQEFYLDCKTFDQNTGQEYPNTLRFQVVGDKINLLNSIQRGERITVNFNIKGRDFQKEDGTKGHVHNLTVWKIDKVVNPTPQTSTQPTISTSEDEDDDLPF